MRLTIQIISYCRLDARANRIFRGAQKFIVKDTQMLVLGIMALDLVMELWSLLRIYTQT